MTRKFVLRCIEAPFLDLILPVGTCVVGRSSQCDFVVKDSSVSRRHARFDADGSGGVVTDLGSLNGTFVDELQVKTSRVILGQTVRFGRVSFLVVSEGGAKQLDLEEKTDRCGKRTNKAPEMCVKQLEVLTDAQKRVFDLLLSGQPEKTIARRLALSPKKKRGRGSFPVV
jgi:pSer/pThr/pTyr-binding forkhead associated (FHA) protein